MELKDSVHCWLCLFFLLTAPHPKPPRKLTCRCGPSVLLLRPLAFHLPTSQWIQIWWEVALLSHAFPTLNRDPGLHPMAILCGSKTWIPGTSNMTSTPPPHTHTHTSLCQLLPKSQWCLGNFWNFTCSYILYCKLLQLLVSQSCKFLSLTWIQGWSILTEPCHFDKTVCMQISGWSWSHPCGIFSKSDLPSPLVQQ